MNKIEKAKKDMELWKGTNKYLYNKAKLIVEGEEGEEGVKAVEEKLVVVDDLKERLEKMERDELVKFAESVGVKIEEKDKICIHSLLIADAKRKISLWDKTNKYLSKQAKQRLAELEEGDKDEIVIEDKKDSKGKLSYTDLKDMNTKRQVKILKEDYGLDDKSIKMLSNEEKRIKKILALQK